MRRRRRGRLPGRPEMAARAGLPLGCSRAALRHFFQIRKHKEFQLLGAVVRFKWCSTCIDGVVEHSPQFCSMRCRTLHLPVLLCTFHIPDHVRGMGCCPPATSSLGCSRRPPGQLIRLPLELEGLQLAGDMSSNDVLRARAGQLHAVICELHVYLSRLDGCKREVWYCMCRYHMYCRGLCQPTIAPPLACSIARQAPGRTCKCCWSAAGGHRC